MVWRPQASPQRPSPGARAGISSTCACGWMTCWSAWMIGCSARAASKGPVARCAGLRLSCAAAEAGVKAEGEVCFDDLVLFLRGGGSTASVPGRDSGRTCRCPVISSWVWVAARAAKVEAARSDGATDARLEPGGAVSFRSGRRCPRTTDGEQVRVWLHSAREGNRTRWRAWSQRSTNAVCC